MRNGNAMKAEVNSGHFTLSIRNSEGSDDPWQSSAWLEWVSCQPCDDSPHPECLLQLLPVKLRLEPMAEPPVCEWGGSRLDHIC